jgi:hypothetical protein
MSARIAVGILIFAAGCGGSGSTPARVAAPAPGHAQTPVAAPTIPAPQPAAPNARASDATMAYWNGLNSVPGQIAQDLKKAPAVQVRTLRQAVAVIRGNPTLGVDADLVAWALKMADLLEERAALIEQSRSPALLAEAFVRGLAGDPFGVGIELNQAERAWVAAARTHHQGWHRLRAALTSRYGVQFP